MAFAQLAINKTLPLFFNIHQNVGLGCPNAPEDVSLVSLLMVNYINTHPSPGPALAKAKEVAARVTIGTYNSDMQELIDILQESYSQNTPSAQRDHRISRAAKDVHYNPSGASYLICVLNYYVGQRNSEIWPRIDKLSGADGGVKDMIKREILVS